jgi:cytidine deaminase
MSRNVEALFSAAHAAYDNAYAPYSKFSVGAAVRTAEGEIFAGCNVENAAYPQGWCAETSALGAMASAGRRRVVEVCVVGGGPGLCTPCGGCRQKLREFCAPDTPIHIAGPEGLRASFTLAHLLPESFGPENLG